MAWPPDRYDTPKSELILDLPYVEVVMFWKLLWAPPGKSKWWPYLNGYEPTKNGVFSYRKIGPLVLWSWTTVPREVRDDEVRVHEKRNR